MAQKFYGTRKCLVCKKEFEASYSSQVTCSDKCKFARRKTLKTESRKSCRDALWDNLEWLNGKLEELIGWQKKNYVKAAITQKPVSKDMKEKKTDAKKAHSEYYRHICANCGSTFKSLYKEDSYCSDQCAKEGLACRAI